jgi:2-polyprenyl-6-methoxyphenol hydroxylase-like FAD-dependent oxidoreductase
MRVPLARASDIGEMRLCSGGCVGVAPLAGKPYHALHNVTVLRAQGSFDPRSGARAIVTQALAAFPELAAAAADAQIMASGPFDWPIRRTVFDGAALVGDAAGYYDPFTGQGIYQALAGAERLAESAAEALRRDVVSARSLHGYARAQRQLSAGPRYVQRLVEFVCARPALAERAFAKLARADAITAALIGVTGDLLPARALLFPGRSAQVVT